LGHERAVVVLGKQLSGESAHAETKGGAGAGIPAADDMAGMQMLDYGIPNEHGDDLVLLDDEPKSPVPASRSVLSE
jgi:hypothetical protein